YVGLGVSAARFDPNCACPSKGDVDKTAGVIGRVGYDFNQYVGLEARGIRTNWKSDGGKIKHLGLFAKPMYPVSEDFNVYGLAGSAKTTTQGSKRRVDAQTLAWGAGLEFDLTDNKPKKGKYSRDFDGYGDQEGGWGLFADYERLVQKSGSPDLDTINFGVTYDF
ncbi:MAG TPA: porin family protein, partial [Campylobacterales bacterium]|nr:porin family protein [Campylobacterales bacterium]